MNRIYLNNNWKYKQDNSAEWKEAKVPGNIHLDLLNNKEISDPYYRLNEQEHQWIGEVDWEYFSLFSENIFYFNYLKHLTLENPQITYFIEKVDNDYQIILNSKKIAKNVKINIQGSEGFLSDNYFDLIPTEKKTISYKPNNKWDENLKLLHYYLVSESVNKLIINQKEVKH